MVRECSLNDVTLSRIFGSCGIPKRDNVVIIAQVTKGSTKWREEKCIKGDDRFTAMQKATAFPISAIARLMADVSSLHVRHPTARMLRNAVI